MLLRLRNLEPRNFSSSITPFHITFRVAEPEVLARHLRFSANGVTARGLGEVSAANGAGNPVLYAVQSAEGHVLQFVTGERWAALNL